jgi:hypothetical protein
MIPKLTAPRRFEMRICEANVATAATAIPTTFWEVPERMLR